MENNFLFLKIKMKKQETSSKSESEISLVSTIKVPPDIGKLTSIVDSLLSLNSENIETNVEKVIEASTIEDRMTILKIIGISIKSNPLEIEEYAKFVELFYSKTETKMTKEEFNILPNNIQQIILSGSYLTDDEIQSFDRRRPTKEEIKNISIKNTIEKGTIEFLIMKDDVESLKSKYERDNINHNFFNIKNIEKESTITNLMFCALCKSEKCFKFFINEGNEITDKEVEFLARYGTKPMCEICPSDTLPLFESYYKTSIEYNNNEATDFIIKSCGYHKMNIKNAIRSFNTRAVLYHINKIDRNNSTPLKLAIEESYYFVEYLLNNGANVNNESFIESCKSHDLRIFNLLLEKGTDINAINNDDETALFASCNGNSNKEIFKILVSKGANIKEKRNNGDNLLHESCENGRLDVVQYLIEQGFDINEENIFFNNIFIFSPNCEGHSPLAIAYDNNEFDIVDFLTSKGAEFNKYEIVESPLIYAIKSGDLTHVKRYISEGIDVNIRDSDNKTPLMHALNKIGNSNKYNSIVNLLIENGADINVKHEGNTTLHMAIEGDANINFIEELISAGFDVNANNIPSFLFCMLYLQIPFFFFSSFTH